jgi:DNA polymerase III epsilon subunit-like protein
VPGLANYRLDSVADHFSIPILERHRAGSDALATAEVFLRILERLETLDIRDLEAVRRFQSPELPNPNHTSKRKSVSAEPQILPLVSGL